MTVDGRSLGVRDVDHRFMQTALTLGRRGLGGVWPNPAVGCVIVAQGRIVGRGWTQPGGRPHAETVALAQAGAAARGGTAYVTLEPCAHTGKTPPCAQALITAGIGRVVAAVQDSDPRVSGQGFSMLRAAGIEVTTGICTQQALSDHAGFFLRTEQGRPLVTLKLALSLDGRIATRRGDSQWITGSVARRRVHALRASHDAVLVGAGTARADDPSLTVRGLGVAHQPVRVIATRDLDIQCPSALSQSARDIPVWLCHGANAPQDRAETWRAAGAELVPCGTADTGLDVGHMLHALGAKGLTRVFCEGGGHLAASLIRAGLVDQMIVHSAGVAIGGDGQAGLAGMGLDVLAHAPRWHRVSQQALGPDIETIWRPIQTK